MNCPGPGGRGTGSNASTRSCSGGRGTSRCGRTPTRADPRPTGRVRSVSATEPVMASAIRVAVAFQPFGTELVEVPGGVLHPAIEQRLLQVEVVLKFAQHVLRQRAGVAHADEDVPFDADKLVVPVRDPRQPVSYTHL